MTTHVLSDAEIRDRTILSQREPHWRDQGWTTQEVAEAREHALRGTDPPCVQSPGTIWELVREMAEHLATRRVARERAAERDAADDLEIAP